MKRRRFAATLLAMLAWTTSCSSTSEIQPSPTETPVNRQPVFAELIVSGTNALSENRLRTALKTLDFQRIESLGSDQFLIVFNTPVSPRELETLLEQQEIQAQVSSQQTYQLPESPGSRPRGKKIRLVR